MVHVPISIVIEINFYYLANYSELKKCVNFVVDKKIASELSLEMLWREV